MTGQNKLWTFIRILFLRLRFVFVFIAIGLIVSNWSWIMNVADKWSRRLWPAKAAETAEAGYEWFCPMHLQVVRDHPDDKCPICGMSLSKRKKEKQGPLPEGVLARRQLSPFRIQQAGVAAAAVDYRTLVREIRTVGAIDYDERRLAHITARTAGRIDKLFVDFTGTTVKKNDPLVWIYSPNLVTTQEEYLLALKALEQIKSQQQHEEGAVERARRNAESALERLRLWGVTEEQMAELEKTRKVEIHLQVLSPIEGTAIARNVLAGQYVNEGTELYLLADLSTVWMQAEVFERDIGIVQIGQAIEITSEAYPGESFSGTISFINPSLEVETRTVKVRVDVLNREAKLKPGMFVTAVLRVPLGKRGEVFFGCCENCPDIRSEEPGKCPKCRMELTRQGGVTHAHAEAAAAREAGKEGAPAAAIEAKERSIYVCDGHPEEVYDQPGKCFKGTCAGMDLLKRKLPAGSKVVYTCSDHPEVQAEKPGTCPKDQKPLHYKVASEATRLAEAWMCPLHPERADAGKEKCPSCGGDMKRFEFERALAVPFGAVIDTGFRKVVFVDRGNGVFDAVEVVLGPRAGEYYQVLGGLSAGDRVVTAGAFLLDAETRLNPSAGAVYFGASGHGGHR